MDGSSRKIHLPTYQGLTLMVMAKRTQRSSMKAQVLWWLASSTARWTVFGLAQARLLLLEATTLMVMARPTQLSLNHPLDTLSWIKSSTGEWDSADLGTGTYELVN